MRDRVDHSYRIEIDAPPDFELVAGVNPFPVPAGGHAEARVFVLAPSGGPPTRRLVFRVEQTRAPRSGAESPAIFVAPRDGPPAGARP